MQALRSSFQSLRIGSEILGNLRAVSLSSSNERCSNSIIFFLSNMYLILWHIYNH